MSTTSQVILALMLAFALSGCAAGQPFIQGPTLEVITVQPVWSTPAQIKERCGQATVGCATVGQYNGQLVQMWVEKPLAFDDFWRVYSLGHELLHALGATHE